MTRRKGKRRSGVLVGVISLAASVLVAEAGVRVFLKRLVATQLLRARLEQTSIKDLIQLTTDKEILYTLKPGLSTDFRGSSVFTDAEGVRVSGRVGSPPRPGESAVRIAVLGDSTSFGFRIDYDDTYAEKLRRQLEAETGIRVELRNYSVPGYNAKQETRIFLNKVLDYKPDLVILQHDHNDAQATGFTDPPNFFGPEYGDNPLHSALIKLILRRLRALRNPWSVSRDDSNNEYYGPYIVRGPLYDEHLASRQELVSQARARGIPVIALIFNAYVRADPDFERSQIYLRLHKELGDRLEAMGFYVLDLYPRYQRLLQQKGWSDLSPWWVEREPVDAHPNPQGHQFIADALLEYLHQKPELMRLFQKKSGTTSQKESK